MVSKVLEELTESNMSDAEVNSFIIILFNFQDMHSPIFTKFRIIQTLGSHIVTAAFARILLEKDVISSGRIEKLLMSSV